MSESNFQFYKTIQGLNGASGIVNTGDNFVLIADDSFVLYVFSTEDNSLNKINLKGELSGERIEKTLKPDFESITIYKGDYFIFGSGSADNRFDQVQLKTETFEIVERKSLKPLYAEMMKSANISKQNFNIEGVILADEFSYFFNRGNGPDRANGVFKVKNFEIEKPEIEFYKIELKETDGVSFGFTDACRSGELIYFIASAESGGSTYHDGEILGSAIGILNFADLSLREFKIITDQHKLEGIGLLNENADFVEFILCEDADDELNETKLFKYKHRKNNESL